MNVDIQSRIQTAIRATAPIVAIPIEGHAPFCVRRKLLAGWAKGVTVHKAEARLMPEVVREKFHEPDSDYDEVTEEWRRPEGPANRVVLRDPAYWTLEVRGRGKGASCRARFVPIARREAMVELGKWSDKERERQAKKRALGALGLTAAERREFKRAKFEDDGEGMIETNYSKANAGGIEKRRGVPVRLAETPRLQYAMVAVKFHDGELDHFALVEVTSGLAAGTGGTAEAAIVEAKLRMQKAGPEALAAVEARITEAVTV